MRSRVRQQRMGTKDEERKPYPVDRPMGLRTRVGWMAAVLVSPVHAWMWVATIIDREAECSASGEREANDAER